MHYYKRNIGNYRRRTQHLSLLEHGIYNQMIDQYYLDEHALPADENRLFRMLSIKTKSEKNAARNVIADFFTLDGEFLTHPDCQKNVEAYQSLCQRNQQNAKAPRKPVASQSLASGKPEESASGLTNNQEPITNNQKQSSSQKTKFSDDDLKTAKLMFSLIKDLNSSAKEPNFSKWADTIRLMRERDSRTHNEINDLFLWANNDAFWKTNILSPETLRKQWDKLTIKKGQTVVEKHDLSNKDYGTMRML